MVIAKIRPGGQSGGNWWQLIFIAQNGISQLFRRWRHCMLSVTFRRVQFNQQSNGVFVYKRARSIYKISILELGGSYVNLVFLKKKHLPSLFVRVFSLLRFLIQFLILSTYFILLFYYSYGSTF